MAQLALEACARAELAQTEIASVGIGVPSAVHPRTKRVVSAGNLAWKNVDVGSEFQKHWNIRVEIANDADCAALGECLAGAAKGYASGLMVTLGTGVGCGIVIDKKPFYGGDGAGIEGGHIPIVHNGLPCTCGHRGCFEVYASATALIRQSREQMMAHPQSLMWELCGRDLSQVDGKTAFEAAKRGDAAGRTVVKHYIAYLASGLIGMITMLRPEIVLLGGGLSGAGEALFTPLRAEVLNRLYNAEVFGCPPIFPAALGNDAGVIGAAMMGRSGTK